MTIENTKHLRISNFAYDLPDERIAKYPLPERDKSKLLHYKGGNISEGTFDRLPELLQSGGLMVFNNTRVIYARLHFRKATGGLIEVFCLEPHVPSDYQQSFATGGSVTWICLVGNSKKWKEGALEREISVGGRTLVLRAVRGAANGSGFEISFDWGDDGITFAEVLEATGELPIPPYLNRATEARDLQTYQTVYSKVDGSVAAPTAGLHFTPAVLEALARRGMEREEVTLHVGAGTFKPVKSEEIAGHAMHAEWFSVRRSTLQRLLEHGGTCIAVGTTSVRTLESLYWLGILVSRNPALPPAELHVPQWIPYEEPAELSATEALRALSGYLERNALAALHATTQILIAPGYTFRIVRTLVTNFHQPKSTLLLLVSAFTGGHWREIYGYALDHDFRFLSYGDSSLLER
ncbi:MAG: S-adenosylmethionine:tRNA ribosyltransferase-isomerase [Alloprevotella sp.]|nr:S-adenosylmethionine:tRNA ribosyltransferase-isomerase [Alloprevotella sp.]